MAGGPFKADGREINYSGTLLPDGAGLLTLVDVTDTRTKQKALEDSNKALANFNEMRSRFIENTSYQLRTPLTSIMGFAEMLEQGFLGELQPKQRDYLRDILKSSQKLDALIGDLLDLTLLGSKSVTIEKQDSDIVPLLQDVLRDMQPAADAKSVALSLELDTDIRTVEMDRGRIQQALTKILENAVHYAPQNGRVELAAQSSDDEIILSVTDNGPGMSAEDQAQAFEVFQRGAGSKRSDGVGLGLSLVQHIMKAHGGRVLIHSQPGKGTRVDLHLPGQPHAANGYARSLFE
jgi:signal transduction histidine kinase